MTWNFSRSPHTLDMIGGLPLEGQMALFDLIDRLEADPLAGTEPYGEDDGMTRQAVFGGFGIIVFWASQATKRITPLQINWAAP
ncbi:hypothetical protein [Streptomyces sparsogenes]|uniref:Uncharacterized protein n=1 Tax=Streptomyces sparsogenes DSM 40356 TaxID=1331668 RepID=A0A1R1S864_9ACTN|nr:hypothetical protein [Streptomyces sparsogenes]OMI34427.1 hypothetical protein SPAR_36626 [Streptomyces sparsogenes DSM 40356]